MKARMISYTLDTVSELTEAEIAHLKNLANRPDSEIDTSDAPEMTDEQWASAKKRRSPLAQKAHSTP